MRWVTLPACDGRYEISETGQVRNKQTGRAKKPQHYKDGRAYVLLWLNYKPTPMRISRALALGFIPNPDNHSLVDHINGNPADDRIENLRWCSQSQNNINRRPWKVKKNPFKGIYRDGGKSRTKPWVARIWINGRKKTIGYFRTAEDAARAYNENALEHYGEFARLNELPN